MASTILFIVMAVISIILLLLTSISATIGAIDCYNSVYYSADKRIPSAHRYLTIAASLGWTSFVSLMVILIVAALTGGLSVAGLSKAMTSKNEPSRLDLSAAYQNEEKLSSGKTIQLIVIIVLIAVALITMVTGVLSLLAAIELGQVTSGDSKVGSAYGASIIAGVAGLGGTLLLVLTIVTYFSVKSLKEKQLRNTEAYIDLAERKLGLSE